MKKRIFIVLLCLALLSSLCIFSSASASGGASFIAINDTLPRELVNTYINYGGAVYVPCWIFNAYSLGLNYSYIEANNTAHLYLNHIQLFFEADTGLTYDGNDNYYSLPGIMRNGTIYVPLSYVSAFFGTFSFSQLSTPYGSLIRLKDSRVVLSDSEFVQAAEPQLRQYYNAVKPTPAPVTPSPSTTPVPVPSPSINHEGTELLLSFVGLPTDDIFRFLDNFNLRACFFLTAEDVRKNPETLRRIDHEGHSIGVYCGSYPINDYEETSALIFEASRIHTIMVSSSADNADACRAAAEELGLVYCRPGTNAVHSPEDNASPYVITSALDASEYGTSLFLSCAEGMENYTNVVLSFIYHGKYAVSPPSEINN